LISYNGVDEEEIVVHFDEDDGELVKTRIEVVEEDEAIVLSTIQKLYRPAPCAGRQSLRKDWRLPLSSPRCTAGRGSTKFGGDSSEEN
jgi:hypothetical protein